MRLAPLIVLVLLCAPAEAKRHVVARGETLERVAQAYGCSTEAVLTANHLTTTIVPPGTIVRIPDCRRAASASPRVRTAAARTAPRTRPSSPPAPLAPPVPPRIKLPAPADPLGDAAPERSESIGHPWNGRLHGGARLPQGEGYRVRHPEHAFGARHVVDHLRGAIAAVRALHPDLHALAIGDLSAAGGGPLADHHSHQSGLDVDVGFFFDAPPAGYPASFAAADEHLDLPATWALVTAFARTVPLPDGVEVIFLDHDVQARLYRWARNRGTPDAQLAELLQYPRSKDTIAGLVRHWPNHADHLHVRFKAAP